MVNIINLIIVIKKIKTIKLTSIIQMNLLIAKIKVFQKAFLEAKYKYQKLLIDMAMKEWIKDIKKNQIK